MVLKVSVDYGSCPRGQDDGEKRQTYVESAGCTVDRSQRSSSPPCGLECATTLGKNWNKKNYNRSDRLEPVIWGASTYDTVRTDSRVSTTYLLNQHATYRSAVLP